MRSLIMLMLALAALIAIAPVNGLGNITSNFQGKVIIEENPGGYNITYPENWMIVDDVSTPDGKEKLVFVEVGLLGDLNWKERKIIFLEQKPMEFKQSDA